MRILLELGRYHFLQFVFDRTNIFARCQPGAIGDTKDVRIHRNGRMAKRRIEYDIRCLAADTRQRFECFARVGYVAVVVIDQDAAQRYDVF